MVDHGKLLSQSGFPVIKDRRPSYNNNRHQSLHNILKPIPNEQTQISNPVYPSVDTGYQRFYRKDQAKPRHLPYPLLQEKPQVQA